MRVAVPRVVVAVSFFAGFVVLSARPAAGQPAPPPPAREGSAELSLVGTSGNSSTQSIGVGGDLVFRPAPWEAKVKASYVRNEADDQVKAEAFAFTSRAQRAIRPRLNGFGQYGYQRHRFAGILHRNAAEGGLAYSMITQASHTLVVDVAVGYVNERRSLGRALSTATAGTGAVYTLKLSATSDLSEDGHFLFSLTEGSDWRYVNVAALAARLTTVLSLKLSNTVRFVNAPVPGFSQTDTLTSVALVAKF